MHAGRQEMGTVHPLKNIVMKGKFITFEGPEGSGKSTHSRLLYEFLKKNRLRVIHAREPGGTKVGEKIRKILLDKKNKELSDNTELFLYMANRAQIIDEVILTYLKKGYIVICDRFQDATIAYQGFGAGLDIKFINFVGSFVTRKIKPDLTILLDIPTDIGLVRSGKKDRMEKKSIQYHKRVRSGYIKLARLQPQRIKLIKVKKDVSDTQDKIRKLVKRFLKTRCHLKIS